MRETEGVRTTRSPGETMYVYVHVIHTCKHTHTYTYIPRPAL